MSSLRSCFPPGLLMEKRLSEKLDDVEVELDPAPSDMALPMEETGDCE